MNLDRSRDSLDYCVGECILNSSERSISEVSISSPKVDTSSRCDSQDESDGGCLSLVSDDFLSVLYLTNNNNHEDVDNLIITIIMTIIIVVVNLIMDVIKPNIFAGISDAPHDVRLRLMTFQVLEMQHLWVGKILPLLSVRKRID